MILQIIRESTIRGRSLFYPLTFLLISLFKIKWFDNYKNEISTSFQHNFSLISNKLIKEKDFCQSLRSSSLTVDFETILIDKYRKKTKWLHPFQILTRLKTKPMRELSYVFVQRLSYFMFTFHKIYLFEFILQTFFCECNQDTLCIRWYRYTIQNYTPFWRLKIIRLDRRRLSSFLLVCYTVQTLSHCTVCYSSSCPLLVFVNE